MLCSHLAAAGCLFTVIGSAAVSAQAPSPASPRPAAAEARPLSMRPFSRVFGYPSQVRAVEDKRLGPMPSLAPRKICGMKVLPADPNIDRKFEVPLRDTTTRFTIRTVPVLCR
jgi:hypothetical protein